MPPGLLDGCFRGKGHETTASSTQVLVLAKGATKRPENIKMQTRLIQ